MTKNLFGVNVVETTVTAEKASFERNTVDFWPNYGYFGQQPCDFGIDKHNIPENITIYFNQGHQSWKDNKRMCYSNHFILCHVNKCLNPPENFETYEIKDREMRIFGACYDTVTGHFCGDEGDNFLDYSFSKQNSKILRSYHKKRVPNFFGGTVFSRHRIQCESSTLNTKFSEVFFFLLSITDRIEEINRYVGSVNLLQIGITKETFGVDEKIVFDPSKLDYSNPDKEKII